MDRFAQAAGMELDNIGGGFVVGRESTTKGFAGFAVTPENVM